MSAAVQQGHSAYSPKWKPTIATRDVWYVTNTFRLLQMNDFDGTALPDALPKLVGC
jgi:hypothetical protein